MTLSKIVVSGKITTNPEKRFSQNNFPILSFSLDVNPQDETVVRVIRVGSAAESLADKIAKGDTVIVEGRPQLETVKDDNGREKRIFVINASTIEKISFSNSSNNVSTPISNKSDDIVQFASEEIAEDLIDEDEIPF